MRHRIRIRLTFRHRPSLAKVTAVGVIVTVVAFASVIGLYARRSLDARVPAVPPILSAETAPGVAESALDAAGSAPTILLYVTETCPYCIVELSRWRAVEEMPEGAPRIVVIAPGPLPDSILPASAIVVSDTAGTMARELGVRMVPSLFVVDVVGTVVETRTGVNDPASIEGLLRGRAFTSEPENC